ncbi:MAG TPA: hypothetical protein VGD56_15155, partial [Gemmatirosa sp.]
MTQSLHAVLAAAAAVLAAAVVAGCHDEIVAPRSTTGADAQVGASATRGVVADGAIGHGVVPGQYVVLFRRGRVAASPFTVDEFATRKLAGGRGVLRRTFRHALQ